MKTNYLPRALNRYLVVIFFLFYWQISDCLISQDDLYTQLLQQLPHAKGKDKVDILNEIAWELKTSDPQKAKKNLQQSISLSQKIQYLKGLGNAYNYSGVIADIHSQPDSALIYFEKALIIRTQLSDQKGIASVYNNLGNVNETLSNYTQALIYFKRSQQIREDLEDSIGAQRINYNIAILHEALGNYPEALDVAFKFLESQDPNEPSTELANAFNLLGTIKSELDRFEEAEEFYSKSLDLHKKLDNAWEANGVILNIGNIKDAFGEEMLDKKQYSKAETYFREAIQYLNQAKVDAQKLGNNPELARIYNNLAATEKNLGTLYKKTNRHSQADSIWNHALEFCNISLRLFINQENYKGQMAALNTTGDIQRRMGLYSQALAMTNRYYDIADNIGDFKYVQDANKDLAKLHFLLGDFKKAYEYRKKYDEIKYDRLNEKQIVQNDRRQAIYSDNLKQREIENQKKKLELQESELARQSFQRKTAFGGLLALAALLFLIYNRYRIKLKANDELTQKNKIIEREIQKSESLLLNILPKSTALELREHGKAKAKFHPDVSVLFTDFENFTAIAQDLDPQLLVNQLDTCYQRFDEIIEKYNVEKIKTIGDAYMCASGIPEKDPNHATNMINAAIEMRDFVVEFAKVQENNNISPFKIRIGIHSGSVVAGVVGTKKFAYDIWGDTVNIAARMESNSSSNKINISEATYQKIKGKFNCTPRGKIEAKNKGEISMYFVDSADRSAGRSATTLVYN